MRTIAAVTCIAVIASGVACSSAKDKTSAGDSVAGAKAGSLEGPTRGDVAGGKRDTSGTAGTPGMAGMASMTTIAAMDSMQTHMRMMDTTNAAEVKIMLPMHRQMVANMLSQMTSDTRTMNMASDVKWTAVADSIRQDLVYMPDQ